MFYCILTFVKDSVDPLAGFVLASWKQLESNVLLLEIHDSSAELR